jgi:hypothetical protein
VAEGTGTRGGWRPEPAGGASLAGLALLAALPLGLAALGLAVTGRLLQAYASSSGGARRRTENEARDGGGAGPATPLRLRGRG